MRPRGAMERSTPTKPEPLSDRGPVVLPPVAISLLPWAPQLGGSARYTVGLLRGLSELELSQPVTVLCNEHAVDRMVWLPREKGLKFRRLPLVVGRSFASRGLALGLAGAFPRPATRWLWFGRKAVVHYPLTVPLPRAKPPTVVTLHDLQHHDLPGQWSKAGRLWRRLAYDRAAREATTVVTCSEFSKRRICAALGIDPSRVFWAHHGVETDRFNPKRTAFLDGSVAERHGLPGRFLLYPAGFWPHKNHARLFEALAQTADRRTPLLLTGSATPLLDELEQLSGRLGLLRRVYYLGFVRDRELPALYRLATAVVFPSLYEGFGLPPLEAMACGCPVASSRAGALAEVIGDAALELDPHDPSQMANAIDRLLEDQQLREQLAARGLERARSFSWRRSAELHLDAYSAAAQLAG